MWDRGLTGGPRRFRPNDKEYPAMATRKLADTAMVLVAGAVVAAAAVVWLAGLVVAAG